MVEAGPQGERPEAKAEQRGERREAKAEPRGERRETKAEPVRQKERDENGTGEARGRKGDERRGVKTGLQGERQGRR